MNFLPREQKIDMDGQTVVLAELSAAQFAAIDNVETEEGKATELLYLSLKDQPASREAISQWPNRVVNELVAAAMTLNGLTDPGN